MDVDLNEIRQLDSAEKLHRLAEIIEQGISAVIIVHDRNGTSSFIFNSTGYEARRAVADTAVALDEHFRAHIRKQVKEGDER